MQDSRIREVIQIATKARQEKDKGMEPTRISWLGETRAFMDMKWREFETKLPL